MVVVVGRMGGVYLPGPDGTYPPVPACTACSLSICQRVPTLPKFSLANDNLILREPRCFRVHGKKLSPMTFTLLALGRMVVRKIIAEPDRKGPPSTKQKGLRHNTIAFPQARCLELLTDALPAEPAVARVYLADTIGETCAMQHVRQKKQTISAPASHRTRVAVQPGVVTILS